MAEPKFKALTAEQTGEYAADLAAIVRELQREHEEATTIAGQYGVQYVAQEGLKGRGVKAERRCAATEAMRHKGRAEVARETLDKLKALQAKLRLE